MQFQFKRLRPKRGLALAALVPLVAGLLTAGTASPASAIVGGRDATQFYNGITAMTVTLPDGRSGVCGAAIFGPQTVITAAHCVSDQDAAPTPVALAPSALRFRIDSNDRTTGGFVAGAAKVLLHPDWDWGMPTGLPVSDLAVVFLDHPIPAPFMPLGFDKPSVGDPLRLVGWGFEQCCPVPPGTQQPTMLQEQDTTRLADAGCVGGPGALPIGAGELCVGGQACYGDSGSPLLKRREVRVAGQPWWADYGIASRETDETACAASIYTDITYPAFRTWIIRTMLTGKSGPCTCPPSPKVGAFALSPDMQARVIDQLKIHTFEKSVISAK